MVRPSRFGKLVVNVLAVGALLFILGPLRAGHASYAGQNSPSEIYRQDRNLTNFLVDRLASLQTATPPTPEPLTVALIGPPSGAQYEETEPVVIRWQSSRPLRTGEVYVIAVAHYATDSTQLAPQFARFTSESPSYELPPGLLGTSKIPVLAWAVYVGDENLQVLGSASPTYRLYRSPRANMGKLLESYGYYNWW